jgi:hypothetical protein
MENYAIEQNGNISRDVQQNLAGRVIFKTL